MNAYRRLLIGCSFSFAVIACAHTPPAELVDARAAYQRASQGPSKQYTPAELHVAKNSLLVAERSYRENEDSWLVRSQAYIAMRKAQLAESMARTQMYQMGLAAAELREELMEDQQAAKTKAELEAATEALEDTEAAVAQTEQELAAERKRREEAERRAELAAKDLARIAAVKQDDRGTIITLSGAVLFASGKYELLPGAVVKLNQVADALLAGDPDATFVVEGHTDSQGKDESNYTLSVNRANAVRDHLIQHGVAADRITAVGYGEERAVADNASAEGRANNRRVEIVIKPGKQSTDLGEGSTPGSMQPPPSGMQPGMGAQPGMGSGSQPGMGSQPTSSDSAAGGVPKTKK
jgi:outer membrane protein OmpA-like peptidoglycan-associated protein